MAVRSFGFLITRRWVIFAVVVAALASLAWWLGEWQFHRLEDRKDRNAIVERNLSRDPVPVDEVLAPGVPVAKSEQWRHVQATGTYAVDQTIVVRYRTRDGVSGVDVVVPLVTADGTALLVDRGWLATDNRGTAEPDDVPAPPSGEVTVTGWVRADATGDSIKVSDQSTRAISSKQIGPAIDLPVFEGFVDLDEENPAASDPLERAELPELDNGPHFFYGLQWWFFGVLAIVGFIWMAYDEWRGATGKPRRARAVAKPKPQAKPKKPRTDLRTRLDRRAIEADAAADRAEAATRAADASSADQSARSIPPSTGTITPVTKDAPGEAKNAATRPNSSGAP